MDTYLVLLGSGRRKWGFGSSLAVHWVVKTSPSNAGGAGLITDWGAKIPHALWPKELDIKQKQYWNKFNKNFKNGPHQKIFKTNKKKKMGLHKTAWSKMELILTSLNYSHGCRKWNQICLSTLNLGLFFGQSLRPFWGFTVNMDPYHFIFCLRTHSYYILTWYPLIPEKEQWDL